MAENGTDMNNNDSECDMFDDVDDDESMPNSQCSADSVRFASDGDMEGKDDDYKVFNDPIHGHILVHPLLVKIIDTPEFQRLRNIKQLGSSYFVYPGASHNRFEHCIGTSYLAGKLARMIRQNQDKLGVTDKDILCVEMAGLCHDLGHGPFSHMFDEMFIKLVRPGCDWSHEKGSCMMLDHLLKRDEVAKSLEKYKIEENDITFVKEMIAGPCRGSAGTNGVKHGEWPYRGRSEEKSFLYEIVSNERNKVDVDKWDYFARDCHHLGIKNSFDHNRFMQFIRVLKVEGERLQICARDKESLNLYEMFHTRSVLHRRAYQHRVGKAIDIMICEAMKIADDHIFFAGTDGAELKMSQAIEDPVAYVKVTDDIFNQMLHSTKPELQPCRDILHRILTRKLYSCIGNTKLPNEYAVDVGRITKEIIAHDSDGMLNDDVLKVSTTKFSYGMKDKNPIDSFRFFSKTNPRKPYHIRKDEVSAMLPEVFEERKIHIFCKDDTKVAVGKKCFQLWCEKNRFQSNASDLTPMQSRVRLQEHITAGKRRKISFTDMDE